MIDKATLRLIKIVFFDFDGVFTNNFVWVDQNGIESVRCFRGDGLGLQKIKALGIKAHIVSTEQNAVVSARAKKMNIPCTQGVQDKRNAIEKLCASYNLALSDALFVGNDINDIPALKIVGYPVAVADAYKELFPLVKYTTSKFGGCGAVREICDLIADAFFEDFN